jgi:hypothetical protein
VLLLVLLLSVMMMVIMNIRSIREEEELGQGMQ